MRVIDKIKFAIEERQTEGVLPTLVILSRQDERGLFTDQYLKTETAPLKNESAEEYIMNSLNLELLVTDKQTEPDVLGRVKLEL